MKSALRKTMQTARRFASEGPVFLRKISKFFYTKLKQNPALLNRLPGAELLRADPSWTKPELERNERWTIDFKVLLESEDAIPESLVLVSPPDAKEVKDFEAACSELGVAFNLIDETTPGSIGQVLSIDPDLIFVRPSLSTHLKRQFSHEIHAQLRDTHLEPRISPSMLELRIYESKRELAYFLKAKNIPHPETHIFLNEADAINFAKTCALPQVFKTNTGASSSGVEILESRKQMRSLIRRLFRSSYARKGLGDYRDLDYGYALFQEYVPDAREYRVIKIGDSWFGHEKSKLDEQTFFSGSGVNKWTPPSIKVLNFCRDIAESQGIFTATFDVFEDNAGNLLVNEIQTWFGSYDDSQMYIDEVPGRYTFLPAESSWRFEPGYFNVNGSINLRIIELIKASTFRAKRLGAIRSTGSIELH